ncbi:MFS transporter [Methanoculleus sp. FWC-SCC1]|uniref:MFS transporter n=1 Tax=Methanoculleus frigidifontis TaxID=2584085 RepID=A0ABT8M600_9EURY|nr:MFS transporter [Methanoculleus sp. FWC-SCC1]MDN7023365.1 MFS transporter [Methanoculleus sp. FWC-SCC1]
MTSPAGRRSALLTAALGSSLAPFMVAGLFVAVPTVGIDFAIDPATLSWVPTAFFLAAAMFLVPFGRIADIYGVKKVFTTGMYVYAVSALLAAFAPSAQVLIGARFLTGIGAAMIFGTSFALLSLVLPEGERGTALGTNIAASYTGFALGFLLGGILTAYVSWRAIFLATVPVELLVIWLIRTRLTGECALSSGRHLDVPGIMLNVVMLLLVMVGFSSLPATPGVLALLLGGIFLIVFVVWELRSESPILDLRFMARNRAFARSAASMLIYSIATFAGIYLFSLYLQYIRGFSPDTVGLVLLVSTLITAVLVRSSGKLADRTRPHAVAAGGVVISATALFPLTGLSATTSLVVVFAALALLSAGLAFYQPPIYSAAIGTTAPEMYAASSGLIETMRLLGMTISMAVTIIVFSLYFGGAAIAAESASLLVASMRQIFLIFLVLAVIALVVTVLAGRAAASRRTE